MAGAMDVVSIFRQPAPPVCSHTLRVDATDARGIFQSLVCILKIGMGVLFGRDGVVDLSALADADIQALREYFDAFCIRLVIEYGEGARCRDVIDGAPRLSDYKLVLRLPQRNVVVSFDYMVPGMQPPRFA